MTTGFVLDTKTGKKTIEKAVGAVLDYVERWNDWLAPAADSISTASVTVSGQDAALVLDSHTVVGGTSVHVWLSGGTAGQTYAVRVQVATAGLRVDSRIFYVKVKERNA